MSTARTPVACGGQELGVPFHDACVAYDYLTDSWMETGNFSTHRVASGYSRHEVKGLIVTGGINTR